MNGESNCNTPKGTKSVVRDESVGIIKFILYIYLLKGSIVFHPRIPFDYGSAFSKCLLLLTLKHQMVTRSIDFDCLGSSITTAVIKNGPDCGSAICVIYWGQF